MPFQLKPVLGNKRRGNAWKTFAVAVGLIACLQSGARAEYWDGVTWDQSSPVYEDICFLTVFCGTAESLHRYTEEGNSTADGIGRDWNCDFYSPSTCTNSATSGSYTTMNIWNHTKESDTAWNFGGYFSSIKAQTRIYVNEAAPPSGQCTARHEQRSTLNDTQDDANCYCSSGWIGLFGSRVECSTHLTFTPGSGAYDPGYYDIRMWGNTEGPGGQGAKQESFRISLHDNSPPEITAISPNPTFPGGCINTLSPTLTFQKHPNNHVVLYDYTNGNLYKTYQGQTTANQKTVTFLEGHHEVLFKSLGVVGLGCSPTTGWDDGSCLADEANTTYPITIDVTAPPVIKTADTLLGANCVNNTPNAVYDNDDTIKFCPIQAYYDLPLGLDTWSDCGLNTCYIQVAYDSDFTNIVSGYSGTGWQFNASDGYYEYNGNPNDDDGQYLYARTRCTDRVGNEATFPTCSSSGKCSDGILIDMTEPTSEVEILRNESGTDVTGGYTTDNALTIEVTIQDPMPAGGVAVSNIKGFELWYSAVGSGYTKYQGRTFLLSEGVLVSGNRYRFDDIFDLTAIGGAEGLYKFVTIAIDNAGNREAMPADYNNDTGCGGASPCSVTFDLTAPVIVQTMDRSECGNTDPNDALSENLTVYFCFNVDTADGASGVDTSACTVKIAADQAFGDVRREAAYTSSNTTTISGDTWLIYQYDAPAYENPATTYYAKTKCDDVAGNAGTYPDCLTSARCSNGILVQQPPPDVTMIIADKPYTNDPTPTINLSVADSTGITMQFTCDRDGDGVCSDESGWTTAAAYSTPYSGFDITNTTYCPQDPPGKQGTATGTRYICGKFTNASQSTYQIDSTYYDNVLPVAAPTTDVCVGNSPNYDRTGSLSVDFCFTAAAMPYDNESSVSYCEIQVARNTAQSAPDFGNPANVINGSHGYDDPHLWTPYNEEFTFTCSDPAQCEDYWLFARARCVDVAGNVGNYGTISDGILIDRSPPTLAKIILRDGDSGNSEDYSNATVSGNARVKVRFCDDAADVWNDCAVPDAAEYACSDDEADVLNPGAWATFNNPIYFDFPDAANGIRTVYCVVRDTAGNSTDPISDGILVDTVAPSDNAATDKCSGQNQDPDNTASLDQYVSFCASPVDSAAGTGNESGIDFCEVQIDDDSAFGSPAAAAVMTLSTGVHVKNNFDTGSASDGKTYYARIRCQDNAGNPSSYPAVAYADCPATAREDDPVETTGANVISCGIVIDKTAPTDGTVAYTPNNTGDDINTGDSPCDAANACTDDTTPQITVSSTGADYMRFACSNGLIGASSYMAYATTTSAFNVTSGLGCGSGDGAKLVYVQFKDYAGNESSTSYATDTIILDRYAPDDLTTYDEGTTTTNTTLMFSTLPSDAGSGIKDCNMEIARSSSTSVNWATDTITTLSSVGSDGDYSFDCMAFYGNNLPDCDGKYFFARTACDDNAGHSASISSSTGSDGIQINFTDPDNFLVRIITGDGAGNDIMLEDPMEITAGATFSVMLVARTGTSTNSAYTGNFGVQLTWAGSASPSAKGCGALGDDPCDPQLPDTNPATLNFINGVGYTATNTTANFFILYTAGDLVGVAANATYPYTFGGFSNQITVNHAPKSELVLTLNDGGTQLVDPITLQAGISEFKPWATLFDTYGNQATSETCVAQWFTDFGTGCTGGNLSPAMTGSATGEYVIYTADTGNRSGNIYAYTDCLTGDLDADSVCSPLITVSGQPTATLVINDNSGYTNDTTPSLTVTGDDGYGNALSADDYLRFACTEAGISSASWVTYASPYTSFNMTTGPGCATGDGNHTIYVAVKNEDHVDQVTDYASDTTYLDTVAPTLITDVEQLNGQTLALSSDRQMTVEATDDQMMASSITLNYWLQGTDANGIWGSGEGTSFSITATSTAALTTYQKTSGSVNDSTNGHNNAVRVWVTGTDMAGNAISVSGSSGNAYLAEYTTVLDHFSVSAPASVTAGSAFTVTVTAKDASNNTIASFDGSIPMTFNFNNANSITHQGTTYSPVKPAAGSYTFTDGVLTLTSQFTLYKAGETPTVTATYGLAATPTGTSSTITVNAAARDHLLIMDAAGGSGNEIGDQTVTFDPGTANDDIAMYAVAFDAYGNFFANDTVSWYTDSEGASGYPFSPPGSLAPEFADGTNCNNSIVAYYCTGYLQGTPPGTGPYPKTSSFTFSWDQPGIGHVYVRSTELSAWFKTGLISVIGDIDHFDVQAASSVTAGSGFDVLISAKDSADQTVTTYDGSKSITLNLAQTSKLHDGSTYSPLINSLSSPQSLALSFSGGLAQSTGSLFLAYNATAPLLIGATDTSISVSGTSGQTTVAVGSPHHLHIDNASSLELGAQTPNLNEALAMYANGYDQWGNKIAAVSATWGATGDLVAGDLSTTSGATSTFQRATAGSGTVTVTNGSYATGDSVSITVADTTPPSDVSSVNDGTSTDIDYQTGLTALSANWSASSDAESGVAVYWYAIGTDSGGASASFIVPWTNNGTALFFDATGLTLDNGQTYYVTVKAQNGAGLLSAATTSDGVMADNTAPSTSTIADGTSTDIDAQTSLTELSANWSAFTDGQSGVAVYWYAIGTDSGGASASFIVPWTNNGTTPYFTEAISPDLTVGNWYYVTVKAQNYAGLLSAAATSDGVQVQAATTEARRILIVDDDDATGSADRIYTLLTDGAYVPSSIPSTVTVTKVNADDLTPTNDTGAVDFEAACGASTPCDVVIWAAGGNNYPMSDDGSESTCTTSTDTDCPWNSYRDGLNNFVKAASSTTGVRGGIIIEGGEWLNTSTGVRAAARYKDGVAYLDQDVGWGKFLKNVMWAGFPDNSTGGPTRSATAKPTDLDGTSPYDCNEVNDDNLVEFNHRTGSGLYTNTGVLDVRYNYKAFQADFSHVNQYSLDLVFGDWDCATPYTDTGHLMMGFCESYTGTPTNCTTSSTTHYSLGGWFSGTVLDDSANERGNSCFISLNLLDLTNDRDEKNIVYNCLKWMCDDCVLGETTPPSTPSALADGTASDIDEQSGLDELSANWSASTDVHTDVIDYWYSIGSSSGASDTVGWTNNATSTSFTATGLTLSQGATYYVTVKARNGANTFSTTAVSDGVYIQTDTTPPSTIATVYDGSTAGVDIDGQNYISALWASWDDSTDADSGVNRYWYSVGTTSGASDAVNWTDNGTATSTTLTGLRLTYGQTYYVSVIPQNGAGLLAASKTTSDGIAITEDTTRRVLIVDDDDNTGSTGTAAARFQTVLTTDGTSSLTVVEADNITDSTIVFETLCSSGPCDVVIWSGGNNSTPMDYDDSNYLDTNYRDGLFDFANSGATGTRGIIFEGGQLGMRLENTIINVDGGTDLSTPGNWSDFADNMMFVEVLESSSTPPYRGDNPSTYCTNLPTGSTKDDLKEYHFTNGLGASAYTPVVDIGFDFKSATATYTYSTSADTDYIYYDYASPYNTDTDNVMMAWCGANSGSSTLLNGAGWFAGAYNPGSGDRSNICYLSFMLTNLDSTTDEENMTLNCVEWICSGCTATFGDTDPPTAGVVTPANTDSGTYVDGTFDLSATFTDADSGVASCESCKATDETCDTEWTAATWSGGTCSVTGITCTHNDSLTLNMRATDNASNVGTATAVNRTCDATAPTTSSVTPAAPTYTAATPVVNSGMTCADEPAANTVTYSLEHCDAGTSAPGDCSSCASWTDGSPSGFGATASDTVTTPTAGRFYCFRGKCQDSVGNTEASWTYSASYISYDDSAPNNPTLGGVWDASGKTTEITSYDNAWEGIDGDPYFEWNAATDNGGSGIAGYWSYLGTNASADPETDGTWTTGTSFTQGSTLSNGTYYFRIKTKDNAGNESSAATLFTLKWDGTAPSVTSVGPATPQTSASTSITNGTAVCSDANSGLAASGYDVQYCDAGTSAPDCSSVSCTWTDGTPTGYSSTTTDQLSASGLDNHYFCFRARCQDAVGNVSGYSASASYVQYVPATLDHYEIVTQNAGTEEAGVAFSITIRAKDSGDATITTYNETDSIAWTWTATASPGDDSPTKPSNGSVTFSSGEATVTGWTVYNASVAEGGVQESFTITATNSGDSVSGTGSAVTVKAGTPAEISAAGGGPITPGGRVIKAADWGSSGCLSGASRCASFAQKPTSVYYGGAFLNNDDNNAAPSSAREWSWDSTNAKINLSFVPAGSVGVNAAPVIARIYDAYGNQIVRADRQLSDLKFEVDAANSTNAVAPRFLNSDLSGAPSDMDTVSYSSVTGGTTAGEASSWVVEYDADAATGTLVVDLTSATYGSASDTVSVTMLVDAQTDFGISDIDVSFTPTAAAGITLSPVWNFAGDKIAFISKNPPGSCSTQSPNSNWNIYTIAYSGGSWGSCAQITNDNLFVMPQSGITWAKGDQYIVFTGCTAISAGACTSSPAGSYSKLLYSILSDGSQNAAVQSGIVKLTPTATNEAATWSDPTWCDDGTAEGKLFAHFTTNQPKTWGNWYWPNLYRFAAGTVPSATATVSTLTQITNLSYPGYGAVKPKASHDCSKLAFIGWNTAAGISVRTYANVFVVNLSDSTFPPTLNTTATLPVTSVPTTADYDGAIPGVYRALDYTRSGNGTAWFPSWTADDSMLSFSVDQTETFNFVPLYQSNVATADIVGSFFTGKNFDIYLEYLGDSITSPQLVGSSAAANEFGYDQCFGGSCPNSSFGKPYAFVSQSGSVVGSLRITTLANESQVVGTSGGLVFFNGQVAAVIPPGATADATIAVRASSLPAPSGDGEDFIAAVGTVARDYFPDGATFDHDVRLVFQYCDADQDGYLDTNQDSACSGGGNSATPEDRIFAYVYCENNSTVCSSSQWESWIKLEGFRDPDLNTLTVFVNHFSLYTVFSSKTGFAPAQFTPLDVRSWKSFPNPWRSGDSPSCTISATDKIIFTADADYDTTLTTTLRIYDIRGREVATRVEPDSTRACGTDEMLVGWDGRNNAGAFAASGVYLYSLTVRDQFSVREVTGKLAVIR